MDDIRLCLPQSSGSGQYVGLVRAYPLPFPTLSPTHSKPIYTKDPMVFVPTVRPPPQQISFGSTYPPTLPIWELQRKQQSSNPRHHPCVYLQNCQMVCVSWNQGHCVAPGPVCRYKHICGLCREDHAARDCSLTPEESIFRYM